MVKFSLLVLIAAFVICSCSILSKKDLTLPNLAPTPNTFTPSLNTIQSPKFQRPAFYENSVPKRILEPGETLIKAQDVNLSLSFELEQVLVTEIYKNNILYIKLEVLSLNPLQRIYESVWSLELEKTLISYYEVLLSNITGDFDTEILFYYFDTSGLQNLIIFKRRSQDGQFLFYTESLFIAEQTRIFFIQSSLPQTENDHTELPLSTIEESPPSLKTFIAEKTSAVSLSSDQVDVMRTSYHFDASSGQYQSQETQTFIDASSYSPQLQALLNASAQEFLEYLQGTWVQSSQQLQNQQTFLRVLEFDAKAQSIAILSENTIESFEILFISKTRYNRLYIIGQNDLLGSFRSYLRLTLLNEDTLLFSQEGISLPENPFKKSRRTTFSLQESWTQNNSMLEAQHLLEKYLLRGTFWVDNSLSAFWNFESLTLKRNTYSLGKKQYLGKQFWSLDKREKQWFLRLESELFQGYNEIFCLNYQQKRESFYLIKQLELVPCQFTFSGFEYLKNNPALSLTQRSLLGLFFSSHNLTLD